MHPQQTIAAGIILLPRNKRTLHVPPVECFYCEAAVAGMVWFACMHNFPVNPSCLGWQSESSTGTADSATSAVSI